MTRVLFYHSSDETEVLYVDNFEETKIKLIFTKNYFAKDPPAQIFIKD